MPSRPPGAIPKPLAVLIAAHPRIELSGFPATVWRDANPEAALANSSAYLEAFGHVVLAWIWLEQAVAADAGSEDFHRGKRAAARYFYHWELPRTAPLFDLLDGMDRTTLDLDDAWL